MKVSRFAPMDCAAELTACFAACLAELFSLSKILISILHLMIDGQNLPLPPPCVAPDAEVCVLLPESEPLSESFALAVFVTV